MLYLQKVLQQQCLALTTWQAAPLLHREWLCFAAQMPGCTFAAEGASALQLRCQTALAHEVASGWAVSLSKVRWVKTVWVGQGRAGGGAPGEDEVDEGEGEDDGGGGGVGHGHDEDEHGRPNLAPVPDAVRPHRRHLLALVHRLCTHASHELSRLVRSPSLLV